MTANSDVKNLLVRTGLRDVLGKILAFGLVAAAWFLTPMN